MKQLQKEFQSNANGCGLQTFRQVIRCANAAIYERVRKDGTTHAFEAFRVRIIKKGAPLPGGLTVQEDYEPYPGASSFKENVAYCCTGDGMRDRAFARYEKLIKSQLKDEEIAIEDSDTPAPVEKKEKGTRGRKAIDRNTIKMPKDKFTMKHLEAMNPDVSFGFLYQHLRSLLGIEYKIAGTAPSARGKPTIIYAPV